MKIKPFLFFLCLVLSSYNTIKAQTDSDSFQDYYKMSKDTINSVEENIAILNQLILLADKSKNNKYLLKALNKKSYLFHKLKQYDSAIVNAVLLVEKSREIDNFDFLKIGIKKLADYHYKNDSLLLAYEHYEEHKKLSVMKNDTIGIVKDLQWISSIQRIFDVPYESQSSAVEAIKLLDRFKIKDSIAKKARIGLYNHLGLVYKDLNNIEKALEYYNKTISITTNQIYINKAKNNIGNLYKKQGKYELAFNELNYVYNNIKNNKNSEEQIARVLSNLGSIKSKLGYPDALPDLKKALNIRQATGKEIGIYTSYVHLSEYFKDRKAFNEALVYAYKAYDISLKLKRESDQVEVLSLLIDLGDINKVHEYKRLIKKNFDKKQSNANKFENAKYNYEKKERELEKSELERLEEETKRLESEKRELFFQSSGVFILLISIFLYFFLKSRHKKKTLQAVYKTESHISKKVHDEVANDVFQVMNTLQNNANVNEKIIDDLDAIYIKTRNISKEHSVLDYEGNFKETLNDLLLSYNSDAVRVIIKDIDKVNWDAISKLKKETIYKVLQELMVNMKKHSQAEFVALTFKNINKKIAITYSDDGVGTSLKKNTGLQNMENRIQSINGTINFESGINKGFKSKITV